MRQSRCRIIHVSRMKDPEEIEHEIDAKLRQGWQLVGVTDAEPEAINYRFWFLVDEQH